jgi:hypothetical protein
MKMMKKNTHKPSKSKSTDSKASTPAASRTAGPRRPGKSIASITDISGMLDILHTKRAASLSGTSTRPSLGIDSDFDEKEETKIETRADHKDSAFVASLKLLKGIVFKFDAPYRSKFHYQTTLATTTGGVLNGNYFVSDVALVSEFGSLGSLFDEFFVHAMVVRYFVLNNNGGGSGTHSAGGTAPPLATSDGPYNAGLVMCSLFNAATGYSTASALSNNATRAFHHSSRDFTYTWRNNVKYEKHGVTLDITTGSWNGWTLLSNASNLGGGYQVRTVNDVLIGPGSAVLTMGTIDLEFDISVRARS